MRPAAGEASESDPVDKYVRNSSPIARSFTHANEAGEDPAGIKLEERALLTKPKAQPKKDPPGWWYKELVGNADWLSVWQGLFCFACVILAVNVGLDTNPIPVSWQFDLGCSYSQNSLIGIAVILVSIGILQAVSLKRLKKTPFRLFFVSHTGVTLIVIPSMILGYQESLRGYGLGWAFWSLMLGLIITNILSFTNCTWHVPYVKAQQPEFLLKVGLVLLAMKLQTVAELGGPGIIVGWVIPPFVLVATWFLAIKVFRVRNLHIAMMLAVATAICGASAATAVSVCIGASTEDLTLVIGVVTIFTVVFMVGCPFVVIYTGMDHYVGGAWIGGTIDATAAVIAAGANVSPVAEQVAALTKVIQNALIGAVALAVAIYWVAHIEDNGKVSYIILWKRFPKFVLGFFIACAILSLVLPPTMGDEQTDFVQDVTQSINTWYFCYAFAGIGLQCDIKVLTKQLHIGVVLTYLAGQAFDFAITFGAAYFAFGGHVFEQPDIE